MLLNDFSGGLNERIAPSLIPSNQAQIFTNIDHTSGSIKPIKDNSLSLQGVDKYFKWYEHAQEYVSNSLEASYVEYKDIMYMTTFNSYPKKYDGSNTYRLGIVGPSSAPNAGLNTSGNLSGTYTYAYTYYNSISGIESKPSALSAEVVASSDSILIQSLLQSSDPQVDKIRIYRVGGNLTTYTLVTEKDNNTDNYIDDTIDDDIAGNHQLDSYTYNEAPNKLKYIFEAYAMLFGAVGDKLYYSNIGLPDAWPATNFIDFEANITGIASIQSGLLVFTKYKTYLITGTSPETFSKLLIDAEQGCISHYSISFTANNLIWLSPDGVCMTTGGAINIVSLPLLGEFNFDNGTFNNSAVINRAYYIATSVGIWVFDFKYNTMVRFIDTVVDWISPHDHILYANIGGDIYSMFDGDDLEYHYKSPMLTEGSYSQRKDYKDFYIKYDGYINLKIYVDKKLVNEKELDDEGCYNLKALNSASGYGLEIEITGTGEVSEIEYKAQGRQNGR